MCGEGYLCVDSECIRDCDAMKIDELLMECSAEFAVECSKISVSSSYAPNVGTMTSNKELLIYVLLAITVVMIVGMAICCVLGQKSPRYSKVDGYSSDMEALQ